MALIVGDLSNVCNETDGSGKMAEGFRHYLYHKRCGRLGRGGAGRCSQAEVGCLSTPQVQRDTDRARYMVAGCVGQAAKRTRSCYVRVSCLAATPLLWRTKE
ncbi:hypothetical protein BCAR13_410058 [Paraburkholderia caribensis]|nr:hypothetical protein BCAR13_410058 [Paraburkholderia caribensis]